MENQKQKYYIPTFAELGEEANKLIANDDPLKRHSHAHRLLHFSFALVFTCITIGFAAFFAGNPADGAGFDKITIKGEGEVFIIDEFGKKNEIIKETPVFAGETIATGKRSVATIAINETRAVYLNNETEIVLTAKNEIELKKGQIWVFSAEETFVATPQAKIRIENATGDFQINNNNYQITSWNHNLEIEFDLGNREKIKNFLLPLGSRIIFNGDQLKPDLARLRFSKLKKELKLHSAGITEWEEENIKKDKNIVFRLEEENFIASEVQSTLPGSYLAARSFFSLIPERKTVAEDDRLAAKTEEVFNYLAKGNFDQAKKILITKKFSEEQLAEMWQKTYIMSKKENFLKANHEIANIWLTIAVDKPELKNKLLRFSLALREDLLKLREPALLALEDEYFRNLWKSVNTAGSSTELMGHMEALFRMTEFYADRVDSDALKTNEWLNDFALVNEDPQAKDLLKLEIAQKNLTLTNVLMDAEQYLLAKEVIKNLQTRLALETIPEIFQIKEKILEEDRLINEKLAFVSANGSLNEEELAQKIKDRAKAEELLRELESDNVDTEESADLDDQKLLNSVRDRFAEMEITIIAHDVLDDSKNTFSIEKAILTNNVSFSAIYNRSNDSLSGIVFDGGKEYPGGIALSGVAWLAESVSESGEEVDGSLHAAATTEPIPEEQGLDSTVITLVKKVAQSKLAPLGLNIESRNITALSENEVRIKGATIGSKETKDLIEEITFDFNIENSSFRNITVSDYPAGEATVGDFVAKIKAAAEKQDTINLLIAEVEKVFKTLGLNFEMGKNVAVDYTKQTARFSKLQYSAKESDFVISGFYDISSGTFTAIAEENKKFTTLTNIKKEDFKMAIAAAYNANPELVMAETEAKAETAMIAELKAVFTKFSCEFTDFDLKPNTVSGIVGFANIKMPSYNLVIAGEYDSKNDIFLKITSADFETKTNLTFADFENQLFTELGTKE